MAERKKTARTAAGGSGSQKGLQMQICSYYPPELAEQMRDLAKATRRTLADVMREAAEDLVKKHEATIRKGKR